MRRVKSGFGLMFGAGILSGLLGIGSGAMKVIAMDQVMRIPFKVSTTTSNFMIGVTAAASAGSLSEPRVHRSGARDARDARRAHRVAGGRKAAGRRADRASLRVLFAGVVGVLAVEMIYNGLSGGLR